MKDATARDATDVITANCDNILAFLQAVALKALRVQTAPLSLRADNCARGWFCQWMDIHIIQHPTHHKNAPQDHSGLTRVLVLIAMRFQNA